MSRMTPAPSAGKKILWVEDDAFLKGLVAQRLAQESYALLHASEGESALALARHEQPDVIMLDILLAGMDGIEILRALKKDEKTKHIPVIMFSNLSDDARMKESKELGAAGFFVKAYVTLDEILTEIKKVLPA